jgi:Tol biopolymer transport system component
VAGDTNGKNDAFVRDASTDTTLLVSRAFDGGVSSGASGSTRLADGGRYAVFTSSGTDLVRGSTTTNSDVYRRDLRTGTTIQISVRPNGAPSKGPGSQSTDVSADGDVVAFASYDSDLVAGDHDGELDLFVRTVSTAKTRLVSPGLPSGAGVAGVVLSPDGGWLSSRWDDGSLHLTRVDTATTTQVVADGYALSGAFSAQQGRFVYVSAGRPFVRELAGGTTTAIPVPSGGGVVSSASVSGDGRYAAYDWIPADGSPSVVYRVAL